MLYNNTTVNQRAKHMHEYMQDDEFVLSMIQQTQCIGSNINVLSKYDSSRNIVMNHTLYLDNLPNTIKNLDILDLKYRIICLRYNLNKAPICPVCKKMLLGYDQLRKFILKSSNDRITPITCSHKCYQQYIEEHPELKAEIAVKKSVSCKKAWEHITESDKKARYDKVKANNFKKYGTICTLNTEENKAKKIKTWQEHYGVDNPTKCPEIKNKILQTNLEKYGAITPLLANNSEKRILTWKQKYGEEYNWISEVPSVRKKLSKVRSDINLIELAWQKTVLSYDKMDPCKKNYKKYRLYTFPSGKEIIVLGYEAEALDCYILKYYEEDDIVNSIKEINTFNFRYTYTDDNTLHRYIPDFYIKSKNLFIEVKSTYTLYQSLYRNYKKADSVIKRGYNYLVIVIIKRSKHDIRYLLLTYEDIKAKVEENSDIFQKG